MDLMEAIYHRRAVRAYTDRPVEPATVMELLRAAVQAPSGRNEQPWEFGVFQGRQRLEEFSARAKHHLVQSLPPFFEAHPEIESYAEHHRNIFHGAGTLIVIYAVDNRNHNAQDCCLAAQNLMLAAQGLGLGTCPIAHARRWLNLPDVKSELGIPQNLVAIFSVVVGYPAGKPPDPPRREPEVVSWLRPEQRPHVQTLPGRQSRLAKPPECAIG